LRTFSKRIAEAVLQKIANFSRSLPFSWMSHWPKRSAADALSAAMNVRISQISQRSRREIYFVAAFDFSAKGSPSRAAKRLLLRCWTSKTDAGVPCRPQERRTRRAPRVANRDLRTISLPARLASRPLGNRCWRNGDDQSAIRGRRSPVGHLLYRHLGMRFLGLG
jgi:hypothetical protein